MNAALNFGRLAFFSYRAASWSDPLSYGANVIIRPLCIMLLFAMTARVSLGTAVAESFVIGSACFAIPWVIRGGLLSGFEEERWAGTMPVHITSTGGRLLPFLSRGILHAPNALVAITCSIAGAVLFLDYSVVGLNWLLAGVALLCMVASVTGLCLALGTFCIVLRNSIFIGNTAMVFFLTLSGGYIPREDLPGVARAVSGVVPMAHGFEALRAAFRGEGFAGNWTHLGAEAAIAVACTAIGYTLFRVLERVAARSGRYDLT